MRTDIKILGTIPILAAALLIVAAGSRAADNKIDAATSSLSAGFSQMNVPVDAPFKRFSGSIDFDPAKPDQARAHLDIDTASFDLGDEDYNSEVRKPAWLDSAQYPQASFDASGLKPLGDSRYETSGVLRLKGKTQTLTVNLSVDRNGGTTVFEGAVPISRAYFGIGDAQWQETVADRIMVRFRILVPAAATSK